MSHNIIIPTGVVGAGGEQWASGTANASSTKNGSFTDTVGTTSSQYTLTVTGLNFTPSRIIVIQPTTTNAVSATYYDVSDTVMQNTHPTYTCMVNAGSSYFYQTVGSLSVTSTSFTLPVYNTGSYKWYAYA